MSYEKHLINEETTLTEALEKLNSLGADATLFVSDSENKLSGSITDGDIRRGLLQGVSLSDSVKSCMNRKPKKLLASDYSVKEVKSLRENRYKIIPIIDSQNRITRLVNFARSYSILPLDALVMAGGKGTRLRPMTENVPKPLLKVGEKPIIDHNIDRLMKYGIFNFHISLGYLGNQIENHFNQKEGYSCQFNFIKEKTPLGTLGAASLVPEFKNEYVLVTNSDILTNLDYESFFLDFLDKKADISIATIPYEVKVPYAVLETSGHKVNSFIEKPTYTYYSNGGIYIVKKSLLTSLEANKLINATDLIDEVIKNKGRVISYPIHGYWLDVGKHDDLRRAQEDVNHIKF
jgi:dTDP-glucose pyrophosphorylase